MTIIKLQADCGHIIHENLLRLIILERHKGFFDPDPTAKLFCYTATLL